MASKGSWSSPIYISDDEDENDVAGQLAYTELDSTPQNTPHHTQNQLSTVSEPVYTPMETNFEPRSTLQKRKRDDAFTYPIPGPSRLNSIHETGMPNFETKKARKRRRRLEREEAMAHSRSQASAPPFAVLPFIPALNSWRTTGPTFNPYPMAMPAPLVYPEHGGYNLAPPDHMYHARPPPQTYSHPQRYDSARHEPSTWVSSMAATGSSNPDLDFWDAYPSAPPPVEPPPPPPPPPAISPPRPVTPVPPPAPPAVKTTVPKKPVSLIIGMNPDKDRHSKHGTFNHSPNTITSLPANPASSEAYIPNPARTIVMEQLPKTHRTREFIKSWSKAACGAHPVYFAVDPGSAKALIEFATAELARKAWGSPKLGGVTGPPIKGKPRADLIRVWWYRVDGVGAGAGVGEIEEGEIEGDAGEREVSVPPEALAAKKETKKERKARLAREREAKMPKAQPEGSMTPSLASSETSTMAVADEVIPEAPPYANVSAPPDPYPFFPESPPPAYSDPNPVWPVDAAWVRAAPPFRPRPPLPPQSALETQWQAPNRRPEWGDYNGTNSFAPTPATPPPNGAAVDPPLPPALPHPPLSFASEPQADVDVDMELDTPASPTFPYTLPSGPLNDATPAVSDRVPDPAPLPPRPPPPASWPLPTPTPTPPPVLPPAPASPSPRSSPALGTPPLEPRAMKNAPKGPSFVKRSLVARHKDLEERIARGKLELGLKGLSTDTTPLPSPSIDAPPPVAEDGSSAASMEDNLRRLVLKSQKNKFKPPAPMSISTASLVSESTASSSAGVSPQSATPPPVPAVAVAPPADFSLDDLAVSFITETIQTLVPGASAPLPPPPPKAASAPTSNASLKQTLAAKQKRLEQHIAESKTLMAQLTGARSKQEKERILGVMRERSRMMEEETQAESQPQAAVDKPQKPSVEQAPVVKLRWPESRNDVCVLIISDDEDEGSESESEDGEP